MQARTPKANQQPAVAALGSGGPIPSPPKGKLPPVDQQKNQQTEEILNAILPPRWAELYKLICDIADVESGLKLDNYGCSVSLALQQQD